MAENNIELEIATQIAKILDISTESVAGIQQCFEVPKNKELADLAIPVPKLNKFKKLAGKPDDVANNLKSKIELNNLVKEVTTSGPYLNFKVNHQVQIQNVLQKVLANKDQYGFTDIGKGKTMIVEFSSPNIAKPFHAGHLRSTIIGNFMVNLFKVMGYKTKSINYLGDWGKQYGLLAIGFEKFGSEEELKADPIKHLFNVYVKINEMITYEKEGKLQELQNSGNTEAKLEDMKSEYDDFARAYFKKMEDGDAESLALWKKFRDLSIEKYKLIYERLGITFDVYSGESLVSGEKMEEEFQKLVAKGLIEDSKGAKIIDLTKQGCGKVLVKKSDGASLYLTRDISAAKTRKDDYEFEKMYYVVASQQDHHFKQLFTILKAMGYDWSKDLTHINYGMVLGMSTRKGTVVFLEDILNKTQSKMLKQMKANPEKFAEVENPELVSDIIGLSAIIIQDFSARRIKDYTFNWERMLASEGDTGVYLQYAHARLASVERKSGVTFNPEADLSLLTEPEAYNLAMIVGQYTDVLLMTLNQLEPTNLTSYLFELAHAVSSAHSVLYVKGQEKSLAEARFLLFWAARTVLSSGLKILGLKPLERM